MTARFFIICCILIVPLTSHSQWGGTERPAPRPIVTAGPRAVFDLLGFKRSSNNELASTDSTRMDLYLAVDYNSLEFLYAIDKYVADYSVTIQVMAKSILIAHDQPDDAQSDLVLDRYEAFTVLESNDEHQARIVGDASRFQNHPRPADAQQISFLLTPGTAYTMRLSVQDHSSHNAFDTSFDFTVKDFASPSPSMSDLMIYRDRKGMRGASPTMLVPSIGPDISSLSDESRTSGLFAELYNMPADSTLGVVTEILPAQGSRSSDMGSIISRAAATLRLPTGNTSASIDRPRSTAPPSVPVMPLFAPVSFDGMWTGYYTVHTYILPSAQDTNLKDPSALEVRAITSAKRTVLVTIAQGIPISVGDLDQAIAQLGVIATGAEWDSLSSAHTPEQKRDAILDFWKKKNPLLNRHDPSSLIAHDQAMNHAMEVFYSRVDYANSHFGTTFQAGWKSDRGRVYIELGPPDLIDSHPEGYASSTMGQAYGGLQKPYEIWEYSRLNERYTFVDEYMLGDYRLRGAPPEEGTFIWE